MKFDLIIIGNISSYTLEKFISCAENKKSLTVYLHTSGGDCDVALAIKDYIEAHNIKVTMYCSRCESAGNILLKSATKKIAYKTCSFFFHEASAENGKPSKRLTKINDLTREYYPKIEISKNAIFLTPYEMLEYGYIDLIK